MIDTDTGVARLAYLQAVRVARRRLEGTSLLRAWDRQAAAHPRSSLAHFRTLLAVHNASDLVAMDLPWWTYEAIDTVDKFLANRGGQARVFEYGSGASTVWLARRSGSIDAVEHDAQWVGLVRELLGAATGVQAEVRLHTPAVVASGSPRVTSRAPSGQGLDFHDYVHTIDDVGGRPFDLVLVDGRAREASLMRALDRVADDGLVLLDDAQRDRYRPSLTAAEALGWSVTVTRGRTPCQPLPRETALLRRRSGSGPAAT